MERSSSQFLYEWCSACTWALDSHILADFSSNSCSLWGGCSTDISLNDLLFIFASCECVTASSYGLFAALVFNSMTRCRTLLAQGAFYIILLIWTHLGFFIFASFGLLDDLVLGVSVALVSSPTWMLFKGETIEDTHLVLSSSLDWGIFEPKMLKWDLKCCWLMYPFTIFLGESSNHGFLIVQRMMMMILSSKKFISKLPEVIIGTWVHQVV